MGFILGTSQNASEAEPYNYPIDPVLKEKAYALENEFISKYCSPLTLKELHYKDIHIDYHGDTYLHTLIRGEEDLLKPNYNNKKNINNTTWISSKFFHILSYDAFP